MIEYIIIISGILLGLIGFIIGSVFVIRSYKESPSIAHYKRIVDILTLRKLWNKKVIPNDLITDNKTDHIKHYEDMRDKLTIRKKTKEKISSSSFLSTLPIGNIIGGFVTILIGVAILPEIAQQVNVAAQNNTSAPYISNILNLTPLIFGLLVGGVAFLTIYQAFRSASIA